MRGIGVGRYGEQLLDVINDESPWMLRSGSGLNLALAEGREDLVASLFARFAIERALRTSADSTRPEPPMEGRG
jgi:hypothetical protein